MATRDVNSNTIDLKIPVVFLKKLDEATVSAYTRFDEDMRQDSQQTTSSLPSEDEEIVFPDLFNFPRTTPINRNVEKKDHAASLNKFFNSQSTKKSNEQQALEDELKSVLAAREAKAEETKGTWLQENKKDVQKVNSLLSNMPTAMQKDHPGESVFNLKSMGKLYSCDKMQQPFRDMHEVNSKFDRLIQGKSMEQFKMTLGSGLFLLKFGDITNKDYVIRSLFHLMSVPDDYGLVLHCKEKMLDIFAEEPVLTASIGIKEILENFVNMGVNLETHLSILELARKEFHSWELQTLCHRDETPPSNVCNKFPSHCLDSLLTVLRVSLIPNWIDWPCCGLSEVVVMFAYISLDVNLRLSPVIFEIGLCINDVLNKYVEQEWKTEIYKLALRLSSVTYHHQNSLFIVKLYNYSIRGLQLGRVLSYIMLHKLTNQPLADENLEDITPDMVLKFTSSNPLNNYKNWDELHCALWFLAFSVNTDTYSKYGTALMDLSYYVKKLDSSIKETVDCLDPTKIKEMLSWLYLKWSSYSRKVPMYQRTMFGYITTDKPTESADNSKIENDIAVDNFEVVEESYGPFFDSQKSSNSVDDVPHLSGQSHESNSSENASENRANILEGNEKPLITTVTKCLRL